MRKLNSVWWNGLAYAFNILVWVLIVGYSWYETRIAISPYWLIIYLFITITGFLLMWTANTLLFHHVIRRRDARVLEISLLLTCINVLISVVLW